MWKKIIVVLLLLVVAVSFAFANGDNEKNDETVKHGKRIQKWLYDFQESQWGPFEKIVSSLLNDIYKRIIIVTKEIYPYYISSLRDAKPTESSNFSKSNNFFTVLFSFFLVLEVMIYAIKAMASSQSNVNPISIVSRVAACMILFWLASYLPDFLIALMKTAAQSLTGRDFTSKSFAFPGIFFQTPSFVSGALGTMLSVEAISALEVHLGAIFVEGTLDGSTLAELVNIAFMLYFAVLGISFMTAITVTIWAMELHFMNISLYMLIPTMVFNGFSTNIVNVLKAYFFQGLKIFLSLVFFHTTYEALYMVGDSFTGLNPLIVLFGGIISTMILFMLVKSTPEVISALLSGQAARESGAEGAIKGAIAGGVMGGIHMHGGGIGGKAQKAMQDLRDPNTRKYGGGIASIPFVGPWRTARAAFDALRVKNAQRHPETGRETENLRDTEDRLNRYVHGSHASHANYGIDPNKENRTYNDNFHDEEP